MRMLETVVERWPSAWTDPTRSTPSGLVWLLSGPSQEWVVWVMVPGCVWV